MRAIRKTIAAAALFALTGASAPVGDLALGQLRKIGTVSERYQGYNIEMVEVTGGRFWAPYGGPPGEVYRQRPPIELNDPRLIALAKALGPSLVRVSGTWANNTYVPAQGEVAGAPPAGFSQVLTRDQWKGVVAFSNAVDAPIVTSFAVSEGTRGPDGAWRPDQAQRLADLTREAGGTIHAAEFFNEPNFAPITPGMPKNYDAARYVADFRVFRAWAKAVPGMKVLGPGSVGESQDMKMPDTGFGHTINSDAMMEGNQGSLDAVSYHFYGAASQRCADRTASTAIKADGLKPDWLDRTKSASDYYGALRDKFEPGKPLWNTETGQAGCGGSPWAATFLDTFRYLNQLGLLAQNGVQVVLHNTLAASDYALLDADTLRPRPSYWGAALWRRVMGTTVLASPHSPSPGLRLYAHCLRGHPGGVGLLVLNLAGRREKLAIGNRALVWTMAGAQVDAERITINGQAPGLDARGNLLGLKGVPVSAELAVPAHSIAFVAVRDAANPACR